MSAATYASVMREFAQLKSWEGLLDNLAHAAQGVYSAALQLREKPLDTKNQSRLFDKIIIFSNILNAWFLKEGLATESIAQKKEEEAVRVLDGWRKTVAQREEMEEDRIAIVAADMGEGKPDFGELLRHLDVSKENNRWIIKKRTDAKKAHVDDLKRRMAKADHIVVESAEEVAPEAP